MNPVADLLAAAARLLAAWLDPDQDWPDVPPPHLEVCATCRCDRERVAVDR